MRRNQEIIPRKSHLVFAALYFFPSNLFKAVCLITIIKAYILCAFNYACVNLYIHFLSLAKQTDSYTQNGFNQHHSYKQQLRFIIACLVMQTVIAYTEQTLFLGLQYLTLENLSITYLTAQNLLHVPLSI